MSELAEMATACSQSFVVPTPMGLHLRPSALLAKAASRFDSDITVRRNGASANANSIMSIIMLEAGYGTEVIVGTQGHDAMAAMAAIEELFVTGFGE